MVRKRPPRHSAQEPEEGGVRATRGWGDVWDNFDQRKKARANDGAEEAPGVGTEDMFARAAIAAE